MKRTMLLGALAIGLVMGACGKKKADPGDKAKPEPVQPDPAKKQPAADTPPSEADKQLVAGAAAVTATELEFNAPTGDKIPLKIVKRLEGPTWVADIVVNGKVDETIDTTVAKDAKTSEPKASVVRMANVVVFLTGVTRSDGADRYEARVYGWNEATKQLALAKQIRFSGKLAAPIPPDKP